jgi:hypothetical protein
VANLIQAPLQGRNNENTQTNIKTILIIIIITNVIVIIQPDHALLQLVTATKS